MQQAQQLSQRESRLFKPNAAEEAEIARRMQGELQQAVARIEAQEQQLGRVMGPGAMQMRMGLSQMKAPFQMALNQANNPAGGMAPYVEVFVANVPDGDTSGYLEEKLKALTDAQPARSQGSWSSPPGSSAFRIWPVSDPAGFAARIPFGQATVDGYRITVAAPNPDSAELAEFKAKRAEEKTKQEEERARQRAEAEERNRPDPKAPPDADAITKALFQLKAKSGFDKKKGLTALARMLPEDDRRDEVIDAIEPVLNEADFVTGEEAVKALANWHNERADAILAHLIESDERGIRHEAIKQAGRLQIAEAAPAIAARLTEDWGEAPPALKAMGPIAQPAVIPLLRSADEGVRRAACEVLAEIGGQETLDTMKKLPADPDLGVRTAAAKAMQTIAARVKAAGGANGKSGEE
jgi:HEAT repeat protein